MAFVHLHVHSEYSLLDGACRIKDLVARAKALGQTSVAITDHGVMYGAVAFYKEAKANGIKPIIGCEVYVAPRSRFDKDRELDSARYHLVLLCKNETGYKNLCQLVSRAFTEGFYTKPRIDKELLRAHSEGLIALSACLAGEIPRLIASGDMSAAKNAAIEMRDIFGEDNFYLELQDHGISEQQQVNEGLLRLHRETGIPVVVTNDVHYLKRDDAAAQDALMCIQTGKTIDDTDRMRFETTEFFLKSENDMRALFPDTPEAADNTVKISEMCNLDFEFGHYHLPEFKLPDGVSSFEYLKNQCDIGFEKRYGSARADLREQLSYELNMINKMGFTDYFLIVQDFVMFAKNAGIPVGPGRGSAAGSMVSYCLGITDIDPIKYSLYFERFLNPERVSMPDIDMDFCERRRGEVIEYVKRKYGEDHVAQIVTFNTLKAKNAVRNVAKVMGMTFAEESALAKEIPNGIHVKISQAMDVSKNLRDMYDKDERVKRIIDTATALEDMPKDSGTHAAGVVITKAPVADYVPLTLSKKDNSIATQYVMTTLEELGLLKMDFLGLRNLTVIDDAVKTIRKTVPDFDIHTIPDDDTETFDMLAAGKTLGVFQLESAGMTAVSVGLTPKSIEDITAIIALYRPGPMDSIPRFLDNNKHPEKISYKHPSLEPILRVTYGCIVYQEQVLEILRKLAGFSLGQADMIRRAMSKKKQAEIEKERETFINGDDTRHIPGAVKNGIPADIAASIYDEILDFANYAFNKAHAVSYAVVCYQTAYLKCHFPKEYMAALMSSVLESPEKVSEYTDECKAMGIKLLPPDVNESEDMFTVSGDHIRYGLVACKNIGRGFIKSVMDERRSGGAFTDFEDFCDRMYGVDLNRRAVESLIKCGGFDSLGATRKQLIQICPVVLDSVAETHRKNLDGQLDLFGDASSSAAHKMHLPDIGEYSKSELLTMEHEVTGLYLSGHPMDEYRTLAKKAGAVSIGAIMADFAKDGGSTVFSDDQKVLLAGIVEAVKTKPTKNNTLMAYVSLEDNSGAIECLVFQRALDAGGGYLAVGTAVLMYGRISARDDKEPQLVVDTIRPLTDLTATREAPPEVSKPETLYVKLPSESDVNYERIKRIMIMFPGTQKMVLYFEDTKKRLGKNCIIHDALIQELREMLGEDNVVIK